MWRRIHYTADIFTGISLTQSLSTALTSNSHHLNADILDELSLSLVLSIGSSLLHFILPANNLEVLHCNFNIQIQIWAIRNDLMCSMPNDSVTVVSIG